MPVSYTHLDVYKRQPYGLAGGRPGSRGRLMRIRDGVATPILPKSDGVRLLKGDIVRLETSGGGGFGDPAERDATDAARDRTLGYA